ncbi:hypothetical protein CPB84DRAFT_1800978 [Gymnopilus junonius]|uniref:Uncharacterized protein n=1 Tax=Gymnopilus junonius TaxID=109634 RepID=A0A9P5N9J9_GYMJU|nr:hypothetical protein CPB84DRAFT_1800978 [Gymnopilus junonius]
MAVDDEMMRPWIPTTSRGRRSKTSKCPFMIRPPYSGGLYTRKLKPLSAEVVICRVAGL